MGEYAEMMLDGTCCSQCGEYLGDEIGFPTLCGACAAEDGADKSDFGYRTGMFTEPPKSKRDTPCPHCGKMCKGLGGMAAHVEAVHPDVPLRDQIVQLRTALGWFLIDKRFQVAVGGNPLAVEKMLADARTILAKS